MKIINSYQIHRLVRMINESLDPELENRLRMDLKKYCESTGKDYAKICELAGLSTKGLESLSSEIINSIENRTNGTWEYNDKTGKVNINGDFTMNLMWSAGYDHLENIKKVSFGNITGNFNINWARLERGGKLSESEWESICPDTVGGNLDINANGFKKLHLPSSIGGSLNISENLLSSLDGCPEEIKGSFLCNNNKLSDLVGGPLKVGGEYNCSNQYGDNFTFQLKGCAKEIGGSFRCENNNIKTMEGGPEIVDGGLYLENNRLIDLRGNLKKVGRVAYGTIDLKRNNLATLEGLPLNIPSSYIECSKNLLPPAVLKQVYKDAQAMKSWIAAYIKLSATERFKRMGKAQRDPIRDRITPEIIKKNPVALAPIWKNTDLMSDPVVSRLIKKSGVKQDDSYLDDVELTSDLYDLGF